MNNIPVELYGCLMWYDGPVAITLRDSDYWYVGVNIERYGDDWHYSVCRMTEQQANLQRLEIGDCLRTIFDQGATYIFKWSPDNVVLKPQRFTECDLPEYGLYLDPRNVDDRYTVKEEMK